MSAPVFGVTDVLALGVDWEPQTDSPASAGTRATAVGPTGDQVASNVHNRIESGTTSYIYVGAETAFVAAFAAVASPCNVGNLVATDTLIITAIAIDYSPCASGKRPMVTFTWRDGPTTDDGLTYPTDIALPTYAATTVEIPELLTMTPGDAEIQTTTWGMVMQYGEDLDKVGDYLTGQGFGGEETIGMTFVGTPTDITSTGWDETTAPGDSTGESASNTGYGTAPYSFVRGVTQTVAP